MLKTILLIAAAALATAGAGYGAQAGGASQTGRSSQKVVIPVNRTQPMDGKSMFVNYCAPCHGVDGKGNGPVASALRQQPVDLTVLSRNHGGTFPALHVEGVLEGGATIPSHGSAQMPVWGPIFDTMGEGSQDTKTIRISRLTAYLRSIQAR
jgi:mono/diheme cytochrome c family protein